MACREAVEAEKSTVGVLHTAVHNSGTEDESRLDSTTVSVLHTRRTQVLTARQSVRFTRRGIKC